MGQKVNPISMRLQVSKNWRSKWFASKRDFAGWLGQDIKVRRAIEKKFETRAVINGIDIERSANMTTVTPAMSHGEPNEERCTCCNVITGTSVFDVTVISDQRPPTKNIRRMTTPKNTQP